jgi:hypothetical protein
MELENKRDLERSHPKSLYLVMQLWATLTVSGPSESLFACSGRDPSARPLSPCLHSVRIANHDCTQRANGAPVLKQFRSTLVSIRIRTRLEPEQLAKLNFYYPIG